jgi:hypothetical protein
MGILLRQAPQVYFAPLWGTYIFVPQTQKVYPAKGWTTLFVGRVAGARLRSARIWFAVSQVTSSTMPGTSVQIQSSSGFGTQCFLSPVD